MNNRHRRKWERETDLVEWWVTRQSLRRWIHKWRLAKEERRIVVSLPKVSKEDLRLRLRFFQKDKLWRIPTEEIESSRKEFHERSSRNILGKGRRNPQMKHSWREVRERHERLTSLFNADRAIETSERSRLTWARCLTNSIGTRSRHAPYSSKTILCREPEEKSSTISPLIAATIELAHGEEICSLVRL